MTLQHAIRSHVSHTGHLHARPSLDFFLLFHVPHWKKGSRRKQMLPMLPLAAAPACIVITRTRTTRSMKRLTSSRRGELLLKRKKERKRTNVELESVQREEKRYLDPPLCEPLYHSGLTHTEKREKEKETRTHTSRQIGWWQFGH